MYATVSCRSTLSISWLAIIYSIRIIGWEGGGRMHTVFRLIFIRRAWG
jgi:hypothetical protein